MIIDYKGFKITVEREKCLAGYKLLYFNVYRISDGLCVIEGYTEGSDTIRDYVKYMKERVDEAIRTWGHSEDLGDYWCEVKY